METKQPTNTMNIALPEALKEFVQQQAAAGRYSSVSEYVRELIRQAQQRKTTEDELTALLLEGLNSGPPIALTARYWENKRKRLFEKAVKRKSA